MVPRAGLEPARPHRTWDFKSHVSTYSTTGARNLMVSRTELESVTP